MKRVKNLLGGHPDLLDGFNCFLPEVRAPLETPRRRLVRLARGFPTRPVRRGRPRRARPARGAFFIFPRARRSRDRGARLDRDDRASSARSNARGASILPRSAGFSSPWPSC